MIKPEELRIGNWVGTSYDSDVHKIIAIDQELPHLDTISFGVGVVGYEQLRPIPLTPEILTECCGFVEVNEMYFLKTEISGSETLDSSFCLDGEPEYYICMQLPFNQPPIETLQHMQNLYYFLSGFQELPVDVERLKELVK